MLETALTEAGLDPSTITTQQVVTMEEAERERFVGSPTIRIDGEDVVAVAEPVEPALTCRLYFRRNGRPSPLPDPADLSDALRRALTAG